MENTIYPAFAPPAELASKPRLSWTASEARAYKQWVVGNMEARIEHLCDYSGLSMSIDPRRDLEVFGAFVAQSLEHDGLQSASDIEVLLTNEAAAMCADIGLVVAKKLLDNHKCKPKWETIRKPKSAVSLNLPVITGFKDGTYLDPIGGAIAEGKSLLKGRKTNLIWLETYDYYMNKG